MSALLLKLLAMGIMFIDHLGLALYKSRLIAWIPYRIMRIVGRGAFPIFCFQIVEGAMHTKRKWLYLVRLLCLALISEPFFDQLTAHSFHSMSHQSVILTLLLGFGGLWLWQSLGQRRLLRLLPLLLARLLALLLETDYGISGVFLVFGCYFYLEGFQDLEFPIRLAGALGLMGLYYLFYCWAHAGFGGPGAVLDYFTRMGTMWIPHLLLAPLLAAYRGRLGPRSPVLHRCYQYFYPAHLAALYLLGALLAGQGG